MGRPGKIVCAQVNVRAMIVVMDEISVTGAHATGNGRP